MTGSTHPLGRLLTDAAAGRFLAPDGGWRRVPPWHPAIEGIVCFTGHAVFAVRADITDERLAGLGADGFGGASHPRLVSALAGSAPHLQSLDVLLVSRGTGPSGAPDAPGGPGAGLVDRPDLGMHPRARHAAVVRERSRVLGYAEPGRRAVVIISAGVGGLAELSYELEPDRRGHGEAAGLLRAALACVPAGEPVLAAVAPGNAASLRALLAAGFTPLGSVQLFQRG
jgi:hypothetical protein